MRNRMFFPVEGDGSAAYQELSILAQGMTPRPTWGQRTYMGGMLIDMDSPDLYADFKEVCEKKFAGLFSEGDDIPPDTDPLGLTLDLL